MLASRMVGVFPTGILYGAFSNFDDTVTGSKTSAKCSSNDFDVRPLKPMPVNVIGNFTKKNSFLIEYPVCLSNERRVKMGKIVTLFNRRFQHQAKPGIEILGFIFPLIGNVRGIVNNYIETTILKRHPHIVADHRRVMLGVYV
ncbi:MAG TPA: hypothetical protein VGY77_02520 [Gemmataceae bacterium]|nr:hypothetical protein [Gemmataceae bacterium]